MKSFKQFIKEEVEQIDEISKKLAKSYLDKSAAEREANPQYSTREKFRSRMIGGATADAKLKGRVQEPYKFGQAPKRKMQVKVAATKEEVELDEGLYHVSYGLGLDHQVVATDANDAHQKAMAHFKKTKPKLNDPKYSDTFSKKSITRIKGDEPRSDKYKTEDVDGSVKRNREMFAMGRINKDEFDRRMGYGKYKKGQPAGVGPLGKSLYKNLTKSMVKEESEVDGVVDIKKS